MYTDRRQSPRVIVRNHSVGLRTSHRVRVLDISTGGALLAGVNHEPGLRGTLRVPLSSSALSCDVEVRQQQVLAGDNGLEARSGVSFVGMSIADRQALNQFLGRAPR